VDTNPDSPWNPRVPVEISPTEFEKLVLEWLRLAAEQQKQTIMARHLGVAYGAGGEYKIDVLVSFSALGGALFVVLVECKHQARPVERDDVMVLESKLRDTNAQKAMLFSTSGFQSGALDFASAKSIATVTIVEGEWLYETRAAGNKPAQQAPPWVHFDPYMGILMAKTTTGVSCHSLEVSRLEAIEEWLAAASRKGDAPPCSPKGGGVLGCWPFGQRRRFRRRVKIAP
jgi:restriction system protein